jgi:hypothetical protein
VAGHAPGLKVLGLLKVLCCSRAPFILETIKEGKALCCSGAPFNLCEAN